MMRGYGMLLNVCIYYKAVLNIQCGNLMFQLICDKYFPITAWQPEGWVLLQPAGRCSILGNSNHVFWGNDGLRSSIPLHSQQCQRLSQCTFFFFNDYFYILKHVDGLFHLAGNICSVVPSNLKYLPRFSWCKCCLWVSLAIYLLPALSPQVISTTEFP